MGNGIIPRDICQLVVFGELSYRKLGCIHENKQKGHCERSIHTVKLIRQGRNPGKPRKMIMRDTTLII